ncbi:MAG: Aminodeoxychorismate lyase [Pedosphaera sp.]|nr:Aminodeoxychorismate lyase [Pedosphaera sp.]
MIVLLNGNFVPEEQAVVSVFDRGFLYGDGLFETFRVHQGIPFCWEKHMERMQHGAALLHLKIPYDSTEMKDFATELIQRNQMPESLLRITVSRGIGQRGYSPQGADRPSFVMSLHAAPALNPSEPQRWKIITSSVRVPTSDVMTQAKTCNKLSQILARAEAESTGAQEALLLNTDGKIAEATSSNLFWIENDTVCTPSLASGALPGVTRGLVLELCKQLNLSARESDITSEKLRQVDGIFLSLTSLGIVEVTNLDNHELKHSPLVRRISQAYHEMIGSLCG